jgi:pimeloyl-ACP methyl ester carboxylesterase
MRIRATFLLLNWFVGASCAILTAAEPAIPYGSNSAAGHYTTINGAKLYYEDYGSGAPLVVLHGNGGSMAQLRHQIDFFRATRRVIGIDSRGHGRSELATKRLTYDQMAEDVARLLRDLRTGPVDVIGWSDGGIIALTLALHHPDAVHALAISGANLTPEALKPDDLAGMKKELAEAQVKLAAGDKSKDWALSAQLLDLMITQPHLTAAELDQIAKPILVMAGEHDMIPEPHTRLIAASLRHAQLQIFAGASHAALLEQPEQFNEIVAAFFQSVKNSGGKTTD